MTNLLDDRLLALLQLPGPTAMSNSSLKSGVQEAFRSVLSESVSEPWIPSPLISASQVLHTAEVRIHTRVNRGEGIGRLEDHYS